MGAAGDPGCGGETEKLAQRKRRKQTGSMKIKFIQLSGLVAMGILGFCSTQICCADGQYHFLKEIHVGGDGGWDCLSVDADARRLYVTHSAKVVVIDLDKDAVTGEITNTSGVHGFAFAPKLQRGFASNGREGTVSVVDLPTLQTIYKLNAGENPDTILFEPEHGEVYAFNGRSQSVSVFDASSGKVAATIPLPGKPEFAVYDPKTSLIYDNIEDKNEVVSIDPATHQIVATWPIAPGESASGMAIDAKHHRLFLGCHNNLMLMLNTKNGKVIATVPIGDGVDANAFDPKTKLAFSSCGDGTVTIAKEDGDELTVTQVLKTERGARTMALDPMTHKIYLATAEFEPSADQAPNATPRRPKVIPGTFKILVYGLDETR
jgi:YVTN family beta-propeller protein